jgi:ketosteroid isomerase-like protein
MIDRAKSSSLIKGIVVTNSLLRAAGLAGILVLSAPASAEWKAANSAVAAAAKDPRIAGALAAINAIDQAAVSDDHAAFAALLADDLAVNNPQNGVSVRGATAERSAAGQISYTHYDRTIEYAGLRGDMILVMGEEVVLPREEGAASAQTVHRRFTDLWKQVDGRWRLTARRATIIARP